MAGSRGQRRVLEVESPHWSKICKQTGSHQCPPAVMQPHSGQPRAHAAGKSGPTVRIEVCAAYSLLRV